MDVPQESLIATLEMAKLITVTSPSTTPSKMAAPNALNYQPGKVVRFLDLDAAELVFDMQPAFDEIASHGLASYRWIIVIAANITSAGTIEAYTGSSLAAVASSGSAALYVSPQPFWKTIENNANRFPVRHTWLDLGSQRTERYVRVKFVDDDNPDGFIELGLCFPHPGYIPTLPILSKPSMGAAEEAQIIVTPAGTKHTLIRPIYRQREITLQAIGPTARDEVLANWTGLQETIGVHDPFVAITNLAPTSNYMDEVVYGTLQGLTPIMMPESFGSSQLILRYEELK